MNIRNQALDWYKAKYGKVDIPIYASKLYQPGESWTSSKVWWIEIPLDTIENDSGGAIRLLCQKEENENEFHYLKIPIEYFRQKLDNFELNGGKVSLFLSAETNSLFDELRGKRNIKFNGFVV